MGILDRPYVGTWTPNQRKIIQYTPDALVYLNGDTGLNGCRTCHHRIDIQQFVTSVSVDAGIEPGASSASVTLSIPRSYGDSIFRDGNTLLRNGLEVHVYFRGYFPMTGLADPNADTEASTFGGVNLSDIPQYPYYPVFHGVVTGVSHEYASGYYSASLTCSGMLHFWNYMQIAANGAFFGARPTNSNVRTNLRGHVFTGMSPFSIIYSLYRDTAGSAAGVGFALQSRTNMRAVSSASGDSLYAMTMRYWERRFMQGMYGLRMHGASGQLFSGSTQAYLARLSGGSARIISTVTGATRTRSDPLTSSAEAFDLIDRDEGDHRILRGADLRYTDSSGGGARDYGVVIPQMQAFVNDISQWGQVSLFETTYESKLDIATQVSNICGYEFYQDMDGDLVFKPPLYNLDTSSSRIYRLEPEDIISISFTESEPEATYATVSGGPFQNLRGAVDQAEFGVRSTYYDYRLIAQFGWREGSMESNYYSNARSAFYAAVANLDRLNQGMNSASVTIPMRPEIRPGFPVYIPHIDCFYYVQSISHAFTYGSSCTTTLNMVARRRKFIPPGDPAGNSVESIDLGATTSGPRTLQYLDNSGTPRMLGFPNVVMALDPERINPLFFFFGLDSEESGVSSDRESGAVSRGSIASSTDRQELLASNFSQLLFQESIIGVVDTTSGVITDESGGTGRRGAVSVATSEVTSDGPALVTSPNRDQILLGPWSIMTSDSRGVSIPSEALLEGLTGIIRTRRTARRRLTALQESLQTLNDRLSSLPSGSDASVRVINQISAARAEIEILNQFLRGDTAVTRSGSTFSLRTAEDGEFSIGGSGVNREVGATAALVYFLIGLLRQRNPHTASSDMSMDSTGTVNDSASLLDMLGDRKASMGLNTPGYYRYYSSAHPTPEQQGYVPLTAPDEETVTAPDETAAAPSDLFTNEEAIEDAIFFDNADLEGLGREGDLREDRARIDAAEITSLEGGTTERDPRTVGVLPLTRDGLGSEINESLSDEDLKDFVKLKNVIPTNGLNVRTFASHVPTPTSTDQIFAIAFEERSASRLGTRHVFLPRTTDVTRITAVLEACLTTSVGTNPFARAITRKFIERASSGPGGLTDAAETYTHLLTRTMEDIDNLKAYDGSLITSGNITAGVPTPFSRVNDVIVGTQAIGSLNTAANATEALEVKALALVNEVTFANRTGIRRAIELISMSSVVSETVTTPGTPATPASTPATAPVVASESDNALARRVSEGHRPISGAVLRATRSIESGSPANPRAIRVELHLLRAARPPINVELQEGEAINSRAFFDRIWREHPSEAERRSLLFSTSFGYYQTLGRTLLRLENEAHPETADPNAALARYDRDPAGTSNDLIDMFLNHSAVVRRDMENVTADGNHPTEAHLLALAQHYTGARSVTPRVRSRAARFNAALTNPEAGRTSRTRAAPAATATEGTPATTSSRLILSGGSARARAIHRALSNWLADIRELHGGTMPGGLPFSFDSEMGVVSEPVNHFSPVFPVSDAVGYEHYGTYQYGRGLSIEPGGNYERLMGTDPFQFVNPTLAYEFASAVRREGITRTGFGPTSRAALAAIASDETFLNSPGAAIATRIFLEASHGVEADRTVMIRTGLSNYIMSSRDSITRLPVSNAAFRLGDLSPFEQDDTCECRASEADLLLGAYMNGAHTQTFVSVDTPDRAMQWVADQMTLAADSWTTTQDALRGSAVSALGRRSIFDSIAGIEGIASNFVPTVEQAGRSLESVGDPTNMNLRRLNELAGRIDRVT